MLWLEEKEIIEQSYVWLIYLSFYQQRGGCLLPNETDKNVFNHLRILSVNFFSFDHNFWNVFAHNILPK